MKPRKIKIPLSTTNKRKFSKWVLDSVENWPKFQGGIINQFQVDQDFQRKDSDETFEKTKPPEGMSFSILGFRLFEVFFLEEFNSLEKGILELYYDSNDDFSAERIKKEFPNIKQSIWFGGFQNLGFICRPKQFFGGTVIRRTELPEEVDYIYVSFQKNLPSMITVCFDVFLKSEMNHKIQELQRRKYLPDYFIEAIYFPPLYATTISFPPEHVQRNAILNELEGIRIRVEKLIFPFIQGYFYKTAITKSKLPAIEIYSIKAENKIYDDFMPFVQENQSWFDSMGFQFLFEAFKNNFMVFYEDYAFEKPLKDSPKSAPYKFILFEENAMKWLRMRDDETADRILLHYKHYLDTLTLPLALVLIQKEEQDKVGKIRGKIFATFSKKRFSRSLNTTFNEFNQVQSVLRSIERMNIDFEQAKKRLTNELTQEDGRELFGFLSDSKTKEPNKFSSYLLSIIEANNKILLEHLAFLEKYFSRHVELINIEAIYNLQVITVILAIGAFILGIISAMAGWESILKFLNMIYNLIQRI